MEVNKKQVKRQTEIKKPLKKPIDKLHHYREELKTANVIRGNAFGLPAITVDTHVKRLSQRLNLSTQTNPDKIEFDLQKIIPEKDWTFISQSLILHGRRTCQARKPRCTDCILEQHCPSSTA